MTPDHRQPPEAPWTVEDARALYAIDAWSGGAFAIDESGEVVVRPAGPHGPTLSLATLARDLDHRGVHLPVLLRFSDLLQRRIQALHGAFAHAMEVHDYSGSYHPVLPIKVNQLRHVVEEFLRFGRPLHAGLEAGSKTELLAALAVCEDPQALIICNGYKDRALIETALLARKAGRNVVLVVDRFAEAARVLDTAAALGVTPLLGARARLAARGAGRWDRSTGPRAKFGLTSVELVRLVELLAARGMAHTLALLHFHMGSQVPAIRAVKEAVAEAARIYASLATMGAGLRYLDVGGGLAVDYDGSRSTLPSSRNYGDDEYAADIILEVRVACDEAGVPHPTLVTESGRALLAQHAVLLFDVLGVSSASPPPPLPQPGPEAHRVLADLRATLDGVTKASFQEAYNDARLLSDEAASLFRHGVIDLPARAQAEALARATMERVLEVSEGAPFVPDDVARLRHVLADTYYGNLSVFQSLPDHWAIQQLFPVMPIHRLNERPTRRGVVADLTCDSDGTIDHFIHRGGIRRRLPLHAVARDERYVLGVFLVGAYQEILGDLHNLFGDTNTVHVGVTDEGYTLHEVLDGDSVRDVLGFVQYDRPHVIGHLRAASERATGDGRISPDDARLLLRRCEEILAGSTYLEPDGTI